MSQLGLKNLQSGILPQRRQHPSSRLAAHVHRCLPPAGCRSSFCHFGRSSSSELASSCISASSSRLRMAQTPRGGPPSPPLPPPASLLPAAAALAAAADGYAGPRAAPDRAGGRSLLPSGASQSGELREPAGMKRTYLGWRTVVRDSETCSRSLCEALQTGLAAQAGTRLCCTGWLDCRCEMRDPHGSPVADEPDLHARSAQQKKRGARTLRGGGGLKALEPGCDLLQHGLQHLVWVRKAARRHHLRVWETRLWGAVLASWKYLI